MNILTIIIVSTGIFFGNNDIILQQGYIQTVEINREAILENDKNEIIVFSEPMSSLFVDYSPKEARKQLCQCDKEKPAT